MSDAVSRLRKAITEFSIPLPDAHELLFPNLCSQRGRIWKTLLGIGANVSVYEYLRYLELGPILSDIPQITKDYDRITKDSYFIRTRGITVAPCHRIFRATLNWYLEQHPARVPSYMRPGGVVELTQGPLRFLIQFLKVMPELDAFFCFREWYALLEPLLSSDERSGLVGPTEVSKLILAEYLRLLGIPAAQEDGLNMSPQAKLEMAGYTLFLSGHTYVAKDEETDVLVLWDSMIAYGYHLNFYLILARFLITYGIHRVQISTGVQHEQPKLQDPHQLLKVALMLLNSTPPHVLEQVFKYTYTRII